VFRVSAPDGSRSAASCAAQLVAHAAAQSCAFYYSKVDVHDVRSVAALASAGMCVVDVGVSFGATPGSASDLAAPARGGIDVRPAREGDRDDLLTIAATAFRYSRFHLDPLISTQLANTIKREWVASYLAGRRGEHLWTATIDGRVAGFLAVIGGGDVGGRFKAIDLTAVAPNLHGLGIGRRMVQFFLSHYADSCEYLRVGTQVANVPSLRLYQRAGMRIDRSDYVMHMHVPESASGPRG
jgi:ribosomal protein S18 acetylase RimI-like enzyme